jgi:predicted DNA-binding protein
VGTSIDILARAPHTPRVMSTALRRVNLNLPPEACDRLRNLAKAAKEPEAVYARGLLVDAIDRAEREAFRQQLEASRTPERRARDRQIASALERLRG